MRGGNNPVSLDLSQYNLLQNKIKNGEYGYVNVIYKDISGELLGLQKGKLEKIKAVTVVKGKSSDGKSVTFVFDSITSNYAIKYKYQFKNAGVYKVTATSNGTALKCGTNDTLVVVDMTYSLKRSKMQLVLETIIDMNIDERYTIHNTVERPLYNLLFYTKDGLKTNYDPKTNFKCQMKGQGVTLDLNVDKTKKDFVQFTHKESDMKQFRALKGGDYKLVVSDDKETVEYQLYLKGDGDNDYSNEKDYDLNQTEVKPRYIDGIAGRVYTINVEFRAKDGLRWNYEVDLTKFSVSNSYG
jgi:hypothetical protein